MSLSMMAGLSCGMSLRPWVVASPCRPVKRINFTLISSPTRFFFDLPTLDLMILHCGISFPEMAFSNVVSSTGNTLVSQKQSDGVALSDHQKR